MRSDMFEVIIERPRRNSSCGWRGKGRRKECTERAFERAPSKLGMGRAGKSKYLNENLAPLRRFLLRHVGRPWSAVRSEICAVLSMRSAVQKHVLDHVKDYVEENPVMIGGVAHYPTAWGGGGLRPLTSSGRWKSFYVCPQTGLLRAARHEKRRRAQASPG